MCLGSGYRKSGWSPSASLDSKGMPYPTVLRSLDDVLREFVQMVVPHKHVILRKAAPKMGQDFAVGEPLMYPATDPGPIVPSGEAVEAYITFKTALKAAKVYIGDIEAPSTIELIQKYVRAPTDDALSVAIAAASAAKEEAKKVKAANAAANAESDAKEAKENLALMAKLAEEAKLHEWPAFKPSKKQVQYEKDTVKAMAKGRVLLRAEARKPRLDRVDQVLRLVAVGQLGERLPTQTKNGDLESLKRALIYDRAGEFPLFGAEYVNNIAIYWGRTYKQEMLLALYKCGALARLQMSGKLTPENQVPRKPGEIALRRQCARILKLAILGTSMPPSAYTTTTTSAGSHTCSRTSHLMPIPWIQ